MKRLFVSLGVSITLIASLFVLVIPGVASSPHSVKPAQTATTCTPVWQTYSREDVYQPVFDRNHNQNTFIEFTTLIQIAPNCAQARRSGTVQTGDGTPINLAVTISWPSGSSCSTFGTPLSVQINNVSLYTVTSNPYTYPSTCWSAASNLDTVGDGDWAVSRLGSDGLPYMTPNCTNTSISGAVLAQNIYSTSGCYVSPNTVN